MAAGAGLTTGPVPGPRHYPEGIVGVAMAVAHRCRGSCTGSRGRVVNSPPPPTGANVHPAGQHEVGPHRRNKREKHPGEEHVVTIKGPRGYESAASGAPSSDSPKSVPSQVHLGPSQWCPPGRVVPMGAQALGRIDLDRWFDPEPTLIGDVPELMAATTGAPLECTRGWTFECSANASPGVPTPADSPWPTAPADDPSIPVTRTGDEVSNRLCRGCPLCR